MSRRALEQDHTPRAVSKRLAMEPSPSYLHDFIYGAIEPRGANLIADGFCMAAKGFEGDELERVVEVTRPTTTYGSTR